MPNGDVDGRGGDRRWRASRRDLTRCRRTGRDAADHKRAGLERWPRRRPRIRAGFAAVAARRSRRDAGRRGRSGRERLASRRGPGGWAAPYLAPARRLRSSRPTRISSATTRQTGAPTIRRTASAGWRSATRCRPTSSPRTTRPRTTSSLPRGRTSRRSPRRTRS
jgi:hypothetical protein